MRALTDSIALVVHTIRRISTSNWRNGTNSPPGFARGYPHPGVLPEPHDRRILAAPLLLELQEPVLGGTRGRRRVDRLERAGDLAPVLAARVAERRPQEVNDAGLRHRLGPDRPDRVRQAPEPVADDHADVLDAPVLDLGQDLEPAGPAAMESPEARIARLEAEVAALKRENNGLRKEKDTLAVERDILRKATKYFASETNW